MIDESMGQHWWKAMEGKYDLATSSFLQWFASYQDRREWLILFGKSLTLYDLPCEMQYGLIVAWAREDYPRVLPNPTEVIPNDTGEWPGIAEIVLAMKERRLQSLVN
jgi:hypothetical protein